MRKERKHYTAAEKVAILRRHLLDFPDNHHGLKILRGDLSICMKTRNFCKGEDSTIKSAQMSRRTVKEMPIRIRHELGKIHV